MAKVTLTIDQRTDEVTITVDAASVVQKPSVEQPSLLPVSSPELSDKQRKILSFHHTASEIKQMSYDEARRLVGKYLEEYKATQEPQKPKTQIESLSSRVYRNGLGEVIPWEDTPKRKRGRPRKNTLATV